MLNPSEHFTAKEIRFLQSGAEDWIKKANSEIIKAAQNGESQAQISVWNTEKDCYTEFYNAPLALMEHFKTRGFNCQMAGQSIVTISWVDKKPS